MLQIRPAESTATLVGASTASPTFVADVGGDNGQYVAALTVDDALEATFGRRDIAFSDAISIEAPDIAEDGSIVSVRVATTLEQVQRISLLADNPVPLIAQFSFGPRTAPALASRVKLAATTELVVVVETAGGCYQARRRVEVMQGGGG